MKKTASGVRDASGVVSRVVPRVVPTVLVSTVFASAAIVVSASAAHAGGFATARFGGAHGHPTTDNPTAIYYNPAGLALGKGTRIFAEGLLAYRRASYDRPVGAINNVADGEVGTPTDAVDANSGKATLSNLIASPFLGVVSDFGVENLGVGLAFYAPFGGQARWDQNSAYEGSEAYPGAVDGSQRWSTMEGAVRELYFTAGGAYRLPEPRVSIGATFSVVSESVNTIRARTAAGTDDLVNANGGLLEGRSHVDVSGVTVAAGLGVIWEPIDDLHLGLSYQSQPGFGETTQEGELHFKFGNTGADTSKIKFTQELPDITRFGARYKPQSNLELRFSADYTRWSVFENQCLMDASDPNANCSLNERGGPTPETQSVIVNQVRNWKDTFGVRLGSSYWLNEMTELVGDVAYDSNAVPDSTLDPALMDMNKLVGLFGARFKLQDTMLINVSYTHVYYFDRETAVRERDAEGNEIGFDPPSTVPDHAGKYSQMVGLINLGVEYMF